LNFQDKDSSTFKVTTTIPGFGEYIQAGVRTNVVDGWGKITTPFGMFDAIRVRSIINEVDTIKISNPFPFTLPIPNRRIEYKWLAKGIHIPVLEIIVAVNGTTQNVQEVKFRDSYHFIPKAPTANFLADNTFPLVNATVKLTDKSLDLPTRWKWTITPATYQLINGTNDTLQNIDVKFTAAGNYTIMLRAQNSVGLNTSTKNSYIRAGMAPVVNFGANNRNVNIGAAVTISDSSTNNPSRWKWTILPSSYTFAGGSNDTLKNISLSFNKGGFYAVDLKVTNPWGMDQTTKTNHVWVFFPAGLNNREKTFAVYPNPVADHLSFSMVNTGNCEYRIMDLNGRELQKGGVGQDVTIDATRLSAGVYMLEVSSGTGLMRARFVKE
jgi:PKD repeat protein